MPSVTKLQEEYDTLQRELKNVKMPSPVLKARVKVFMRSVGAAFAANNEVVAQQNPRGNALVSIRKENKCLTKMLTFCETVLNQ